LKNWAILGFLISKIIFSLGLWQLDLLCWGQISGKGLLFELPFNIILKAEEAYWLFFGFIYIGLVGAIISILSVVRPGWWRKIRERIAH